MKFVESNSDNATLKELGRLILEYRLNRNQTQEALAREAGVSKRTIIRIEHGQSTQLLNLIRILRVLGLVKNLEALIPAPIISPIQQSKMYGKKRKRASLQPEKAKTKQPWSWGDEE